MRATIAQAGPRGSVTVRRLGYGLVFLGSSGMAIAVWGLWRDVGWIAQPFYAYAWWSYILLLDGLTALRRGGSLLTTRWRHLPSVCLWSVSFWFFFELLNLRYQNWYYVGVFDSRSLVELAWRGVYSVACFATVFAGLFETHDALGALGVFRRWRIRQRSFSRGVSYAVQAIGLLMITLSLFSSEYLAPLVWGSVTFVIDPWNYRRGARSLLRDLERGEVGLLARILLAGLICGLVWESLNFFAPQKWVYTVRGLESWKLFEMPLLGFLGFPALALDAFAAYSFLAYWLRGNATWENPDDLRQTLMPRRSIPPSASAALVPLHVAFWCVVSLLMQDVNVGSLELRLEDLETLRPRQIRLLREHGIERPRQLLRESRDGARRAVLREALGLTDPELERLLEQARLYDFKGIGADHGAGLRRVGIERVEDLRAVDPETLYRELVRLRRDEWFPALRPEMVRVWVLAAQAQRPAAPPGGAGDGGASR